MKRTHPFFSPFGILLTLVLFAGMGFTWWTQGGLMFSPGRLTAKSQPGVTLEGFASHLEFEQDCSLCHAPLETRQGDLCLRCHTAIGQQIAAAQGAHGKLANVQLCRTCHSDHRGADFDPTLAALDAFDHSVTAFSLLWHQVDYDATPLECNACHAPENGFALLPTACQDCHGDYDPGWMAQHLQDFGADCLACHDGLDTVARFDHAVTAFPLTGVHSETRCLSCHTDGQLMGDAMAALPLDCAACHEEPASHFGLFSQDCAACHTPAAWQPALIDGTLFDHFGQTGFSLDRHLADFSGAAIPCVGCHRAATDAPLAFDLQFCVDCHTLGDAAFMADHQQRFGPACLDCHDGVDRMNNFDHASFFPLDGSHAELACESCHAGALFGGTPSECAQCHAEPAIHAGLFGLQCQSCHTTTAWSPASLTSHGFPLDHGGQGLVDCATCHPSSYVEYTCYGCHEHQSASIAAGHLEEGISQAELNDCVRCHPSGLKEEGEGGSEGDDD